MLKKVVKYTDFDGNDREMTCYFNLNKAELLEMDLDTPGGMQNKLTELVDSPVPGKVKDVFKDLILRSYGVKSEDGTRFIKNKQLVEEFMQTEAYSELFMELLSSEEAAVGFIKGIIPQSLAKELESSAAANGVVPMISGSEAKG